MSVYKVHFKWKEKEYCLSARSLDLTHPYFVSIKDLIWPGKSGLIINPDEDEIKKLFGSADHLMIPFQTVLLIEENRNPETVKGKGKSAKIPGGLSLLDEEEE